MAVSGSLSTLAAALGAVGSVASTASSIYGATKGAPKAQGQPQLAKDPIANVYRDRNAQNSLITGGASTGTGSLLTSSGNVAGNSLLGQ